MTSKLQGCACAGASSAAEIGTLVFAVVNLISAVIATLYTLTTLIYIWSSPSFEEPWLPSFVFLEDNTPIEVVDAFVVSQLIILLFMSLISMTFAIYLVIGIIKRKPDNIKVYLIYGTIVHVVSSLAVVGFLFISNAVNMFVCTAIILLAIYAMILLMINNTHKKIQSLNDQFGHKVFDEKPQCVKFTNV